MTGRGIGGSVIVRLGEIWFTAPGAMLISSSMSRGDGGGVVATLDAPKLVWVGVVGLSSLLFITAVDAVMVWRA